MKLTLFRSLVVLAAVGAPLVAGGMYVLHKGGQCCPLASAMGKRKPAPCACCCDATDALGPVSVQGEGGAAGRSDCVMFGGTPQRNLVNLVDKNLPTQWSVEAGKEQNIKWKALLGKNAYGGPVIANGIIYVGTTNDQPRDPKIDGNRSVLMAFRESDGTFLWQILHETPPDPVFSQGVSSGLCSTPIVEGEGVFYVTPICEVVRANPKGEIVWKYDMIKELGVVPFHLSNCSPLIYGDLLMIMTGNGTDGQGAVVSPKSPSFIAVNKKTGKLVWQNSLPGENIFDGQWSNPCLAVVAGKTQVIFAAGDAAIYSFEPETGKLIWKFDCYAVPPKEPREVLNYFVATPVIYGDRLYIAMGVGPDLGKTPKSSHILCVDITKSGDVSPKNLNAKDSANKESALVWSYGGKIEPRPKTGQRTAHFTISLSTCAVHEGLVYAAEEHGYVSCFDAKTGERLWIDDLQCGIWGSPYYVDGKVYIGTDTGVVAIYEHGRNKKLLTTIEMGECIHSTPVVANGVLYIATVSKLFAIAGAK